MSIATAFELGDPYSPNSPYVDIKARYDGSDWFDPECEFCDGELVEGDYCPKCNEVTK